MSKVLINDSTLTAIADAIRTKNGTTETYLPSEMDEAILAIKSGGNVINLTGDVSYLFGTHNTSHPHSFLPFLEQGLLDITTSDITDMSYFFYYAKGVSIIPFEINLKGEAACVYGFTSSSTLLELPLIRGSIYAAADLCRGCYRLRKANFSEITYAKGYLGGYNQWCQNMFYNCYGLSEVVKFPVFTNTGTESILAQNMFSGLLTKVGRLKTFTFATDSNGTPCTRQWKNQVLDLSSHGYLSSTQYAAESKANLSNDYQVIDDATYQALKNTEEWWTINSAYSRYNHDSAVETIKTLPDCSACGTNTINFTGAEGELTDGGAINTMTEEEIAVATAKGWTVTFI